MSWDSDAVPDQELERMLAAAFDRQVTANVVTMAMMGWDLQDPELLLAELTYDSTDSGLAAAGVRGDGGSAMSYRAGSVMIDFEQDGDQLVGLVDPRPESLTLETLDDQRSISLDDRGRFAVSWFRGPNRLRAVLGDGTSMATEWFLLSDD